MNSTVPLSSMDRFVSSFFNAEVAARYVAPILDGMLLTIGLGLCVIATGLVLGLVLAVLRIQHVKLVNAFIIAFADVFRALPPLVVIILLFFAFPYIELSMSAFTATWLALSLVLVAGLVHGLAHGGEIASAALPTAFGMLAGSALLHGFGAALGVASARYAGVLRFGGAAIAGFGALLLLG
jgi:His/Glu/Gln/Arg/opine family amino acid ABC transporter permease subunit